MTVQGEEISQTEVMEQAKVAKSVSTIIDGQLEYREYKVDPVNIITDDGTNTTVYVPNFIIVITPSEALNRILGLGFITAPKVDGKIITIDLEYGLLKSLGFPECRCLSCVTYDKKERILHMNLRKDVLLVTSPFSLGEITLPYSVVSEKLLDHLFGYKDEWVTTTSDNSLGVVTPSSNGCWCQDGRFHRDDDLPAVICPNGDKYWYRHGKLYRENGKPPIVYADGRTGYKNNKYSEKQITMSFGVHITFVKNLKFYLYSEFVLDDMFGDNKIKVNQVVTLDKIDEFISLLDTTIGRLTVKGNVLFLDGVHVGHATDDYEAKINLLLNEAKFI